MEHLTRELQSARAKANALSEQLFHLQCSLEDSENNHSEAKRRDFEGKICRELLAI